MTRLGIGAALSAVGVMLFVGMAQAQPSNFGTVALQGGFMPDPHQSGGTSGGSTNAQQMNASCRGWISAQPDHILQLRTPFNWLRIFAESDSDTTLVVQSMSSGQVWCADDTFGRNPGVEGTFPAGSYRVWVGSYTQGQNARYTIKFTELRNVQPGSGGGGSTVQVQTQTQVGTGGSGVIAGTGTLDLLGRRGNFRGVKLRTGFPRDPRTLRGQSGGRFNATQILGNTCRGWVAQRPDHIVTLQSGFAFFRFFVRSSADTTLAILTPDGRWLCNDDTNGTNPIVDVQNANPGNYRVWVGSYRQGEIAPYTIGFSEFRNSM